VIAFVFPGQNSHYVGMGRDLYDAGGPARVIFEVAEAESGAELLSVMFEGPEEALTRTDNQQPAIVTHSLAALAAVREIGITPDFVAGHSLGEYSAITCAGSLAPEQVLPLVRFRGELMARAGDDAPGAMAAVLGLDADEVQEAVESVATEGTVVVANYNSPGQVVISGEVNAVNAAGAACDAAGAKRVIALDVSGAFHSPLMGPAAAPLIERLAATGFAAAQVPVVANVDAQPHTDPEEIRANLGEQMTSSVRWEQSVRRMIDEGVDTFVEIGPGTVLSKLIRRIDREVTALNIDRVEEVEALRAALA
jgi:[acyl-carrier-protein] S-malonyltransferase